MNWNGKHLSKRMTGALAEALGGEIKADHKATLEGLRRRGLAHRVRPDAVSGGYEADLTRQGARAATDIEGRQT